MNDGVARNLKEFVEQMDDNIATTNLKLIIRRVGRSEDMKEGVIDEGKSGIGDGLQVGGEAIPDDLSHESPFNQQIGERHWVRLVTSPVHRANE